MKKFQIIGVIILLIFFYGCGGGPQLLDLNVNCDDDCNSNHAVVVKIYQLKNSDRFRYASFEALLRNPEEILSSDLIPASKYENTLIPGEEINISEMKIDPEAAYLGIVADFYSPANDNWHQVIPLNPDIDKVKIKIHSNSLSFEIEE